MQTPPSSSLDNRLGTGHVTGHVTLVGAGPGDPELLTLKAVKALQAASVVLVDDLVSPAVVAMANPTARIIPVGKRGGCRSTPQSFIERLMITAAREGERVVRLKGGDPFMFGRGGEEVAHLEAAGVPVTVVNGITSGLAAMTSLNLPLTHRDHAQGVVFVTGHSRPGGSGVDWCSLGDTAFRLHLTLVIYMGIAAVAEIQRGLLQGLPPETPVALIQNASLPTQRNWVDTLGGLADCVATYQVESPAVLVIGDVVRGLGAVSQRHLLHYRVDGTSVVGQFSAAVAG